MTESNAIVVASSRDVLSHHARSFRWAAAFLPAESHDDAAVLYAFCRAVDDAVDEARARQEALDGLDHLERGLGHPRDPLMIELAAVMRRRNIPSLAAEQLVAGVRGDLDPVRVKDDDELIRYCYLAAGTVGLMMCGVLGVDDPDARAHAVDLGIGMQLTNICRDVLEDATMARVYLPASRLEAEGVTQQQLLDGEADPEAVARVVRDLLALAERYYDSADAGMRFIPARARLAVLVASRVYRAIGRRLLLRHAGNALHGRTIVPAFAKVGWVLVAFVAWFVLSWRGGDRPHAAKLHAPLGGLLQA